VAYDSGFASASRFYESFNRLCGQTPKDYRRRYGRPPTAARSAAADKAESTPAHFAARYH